MLCGCEKANRQKGREGQEIKDGQIIAKRRQMESVGKKKLRRFTVTKLFKTGVK